MKRINCNRKYYTYELVDSRDSKPFYVGMGQNHRMLEHEKETQQLMNAGRHDRMSHKHKRIVEIWEAGGQVQYNIIYCTPHQEEAYSVEAARIKEIGLHRLTNESYGHWSETEPDDDNDPD